MYYPSLGEVQEGHEGQLAYIEAIEPGTTLKRKEGFAPVVVGIL